MSDKLAPSARHKFTHAGKTIYEWDQTLDEVNMYLALPPGVPACAFYCTVKPQHLELGIKGNPPYLDADLAGAVKLDASFWTIEDGVMHVTLQKRDRGQTWPAAVKGHNVDAFAADQEQRRLMLERFQTEHPGFDFSQAQVTGTCPDPRTFLGGIGR